MKLSTNEMFEINGGATNISGTLLNAIAKIMTTILDIGRAIGTAINMSISGKKC